MKQEPELIDLFAMFASIGFVINGENSPKELAEQAYIVAHEMLIERKNWIGENND